MHDVCKKKVLGSISLHKAEILFLKCVSFFQLLLVHKHFPMIFHRQGAPDGPCGLFCLVAGRGESQASGAAQCADPAARGAHGASATRMVRCQRKNRLG